MAFTLTCCCDASVTIVLLATCDRTLTYHFLSRPFLELVFKEVDSETLSHVGSLQSGFVIKSVYALYNVSLNVKLSTSEFWEMQE